jgi:serine/threonine-protein kinase
MLTLDLEQWRILSPYIDEALGLAEAERSLWLQSLRAEKPEIANQLASLLEEHRIAEQEDFLTTVPLINLLPSRASLAGRTIGAYKLISLIGHGGMGTVWLAERIDGRFERRCAFKFLNVAMVGAGEARFKREGAILARLSHPNIARLLDAGVADAGQPYLVLEHIDGEPIDRYCDSRKLDVRARIRLFLDVLGAVAHAHANLIVHRDIKPSNVLASKDGQVKLLDFGIAKWLNEGTESAGPTLITQQAGGVLTPAYAAPEQVTGGPVTVATDVYTLGVLLYELLSGQHPAGDSVHTPAELVKAIVETEPRASSAVVSAAGGGGAEKRGTTPEKLSRQLRGDLDAIVLKALQKDPHQRYASADAFAQDLRRYLAGEPVIAQPQSRWYRTKKFISRRRWAVASVSAVVIALAVGLGMALWQAHIAKRETRTATAMEEFLEGIFRANSSFQEDPAKARQTTARELLDIGARKIDGELTDSPEAKLRLLNTLGSMYFDLGLDDQSVEMQRKRVALARARGNDSLETAYVLIDLGTALHSSRSVNEGQAVLLEAERIMDKRGDFSSPQRGTLLVMLGQEFQSTDLQRALKYSRQAVDFYRRRPNESSFPEALLQEASVHSLLGQPRQAEPLLAEAVQSSIKIDGDTNANLPRFYAYQGETQQKLMEFGPAEESMRKAMFVARKLNGEDHIDTLETELRLGIFLAFTSRPQEGLEHIERARQILLRTRGADHPFYAPQVYLEYGRALANEGRLEDGLAYISKATENRRKNRPGTRYLGQMLELQAWVLIEMGRYTEAQRLCDEADAIAKKVNSPPSYFAAENRTHLMLNTGRLAEAESTIAIFQLPPEEAEVPSMDALKVQLLRSEVALARNDGKAAAQLASPVNHELATNPVHDYLKGLEAQAALAEGRADLLSGRASDALPLLQHAVGLRESIMDPASPALADARVALADCYLSLGDAEHAKTLVATAKQSLDSHHELGSQYTQPLRVMEEKLRHASPLQRSYDEVERPVIVSQRVPGP